MAGTCGRAGRVKAPARSTPMKKLMLSHAFTFVDRVIFSVGVHNLRSQRAVERIGGVVLDGHHACGRDTLVFGVSKPA